MHLQHGKCTLSYNYNVPVLRLGLCTVNWNAADRFGVIPLCSGIRLSDGKVRFILKHAHMKMYVQTMHISTWTVQLTSSTCTLHLTRASGLVGNEYSFSLLITSQRATSAIQLWWSASWHTFLYYNFQFVLRAHHNRRYEWHNYFIMTSLFYSLNNRSNHSANFMADCYNFTRAQNGWFCE